MNFFQVLIGVVFLVIGAIYVKVGLASYADGMDLENKHPALNVVVSSVMVICAALFLIGGAWCVFYGL